MKRRLSDHGPRVEGPWPFVTFRRYTHLGRRLLWRARQSRKGLLPAERGQEGAATPFWQARGYNWLTGLFFAVGAFLFMLGATFSIMPAHWPATPPALATAIVFFAGSIPFTIAGYMQHFQAANAPEFSADPARARARRRVSLIGWHPKSVGWLSTFAQFIGTVAFNFNTFDGIHPDPGWYADDLAIWTPDMVGSVLFLVSGYLAFIETCHGVWAWHPRDLDWRIAVVNLAGCVFFMTAAVLAYVPRGAEPGWIPLTANIHLWLGALGFFVGAVLLMRESAQAVPAS